MRLWHSNDEPESDANNSSKELKETPSRFRSSTNVRIQPYFKSPDGLFNLTQEMMHQNERINEKDKLDSRPSRLLVIRSNAQLPQPQQNDANHNNPKNIENEKSGNKTRTGPSTKQLVVITNDSLTFSTFQASNKTDFELQKPLHRLRFRATPISIDFNQLTKDDNIELLIGFSTGDCLFYNPISRNTVQFNKDVSGPLADFLDFSTLPLFDQKITKNKINASSVACVRWVPSSTTNFLVCFSDGFAFTFDKSKKDNSNFLEERTAEKEKQHNQPMSQTFVKSILVQHFPSNLNPQSCWNVFNYLVCSVE